MGNSDRQDTPQPKAVSPQGRQPPSKPAALGSDKNHPFSVPRRRLPVLLLIAGATAGVIFALFLVSVQHWLDDEHQLAEPDQASVTKPGNGSGSAPETGSLDLWLQAIALPALEDEGQLPIYFRLSAPADWPVDITYETTTHTAEAGTDFVSLNGVITIPPGDRTVELSIPLINDDLVESVEMFRVTLSVDPQKATLTDPELMATVLDDDENAKADGN